jgi:translocation protein SEC63
VIELASRLIVRGMLHIANARNWLRVSIQIIEFNQLIVQALLPHQSALLQLPFIDNEILKHFNTKKRRIETIRDLLKVSPADRRDLLRSLDEQQISLIEKVAQRYPVVEVLKAEYSVIGEEAIVPSSLVTLSIKFKCVFGLDDKNTDESIPDPEEEKKQKQWWVIKPIDKHQPYCPYFPGVKQPIFSVMLANTNIGRLICMTKVVGVDQDHVVRLQFQAPPEPGAWVFQAFIKSDTYVGADATVDCKVIFFLIIACSTTSQCSS